MLFNKKKKTTKNISTELISAENTPKVNILSREIFLERTESIFQAYEDVLSKTLGAYGNPTIISNFPAIHVTKDGYTIARNMEFDGRYGELIDKTIGLMAMDICSRLNYSVGDGTTTALVATNQVYKSIYSLMKENEYIAKCRPRDILAKFNEVKDNLAKKLEKKAISINRDTLVDDIRRIVHISSNGDDKLTDMIVSAYDQLGFPSISTHESDNSDTYIEIVEGFSAKVYLGDKVYINTDDKTSMIKKSDVIMFDHKVTLDTYTSIIRPLCNILRQLGRHLICIAPNYDNRMINGVIKRELMTEFENRKDICLVLTSIQLNNEFAKKIYADLAVVLGTTLVDRDLVDEISDKLEEVRDIRKFIDISDRGIPGIGIFPNDSFEVETSRAIVYDEERKASCLFRLGFAEEASLGLNQSTFKNAYYNKDIYEKSVRDAEIELQEVINKFAILGTYTKDIYEAQKRLSSIKMKMAKIYVGGDSDKSRDLLKDSVEDSIRAAESAFQNGYIQGCNLTLIKCIDEYLEEVEVDSIEYYLLKALCEAFKSVYMKVLENAFKDDILIDIISIDGIQIGLLDAGIKPLSAEEIEKIDIDKLYRGYRYRPLTEVIVEISRMIDKVLNLDTMRFSTDVINSVRTDIEVLTATSDLLSMIMVGNQVVMASYNHMKGL